MNKESPQPGERGGAGAEQGPAHERRDGRSQRHFRRTRGRGRRVSAGRRPAPRVRLSRGTGFRPVWSRGAQLTPEHGLPPRMVHGAQHAPPRACQNPRGDRGEALGDSNGHEKRLTNIDLRLPFLICSKALPVHRAGPAHVSHPT